MIKHLVAFVQNKALDAAETQLLLANQGVETTRSCNDDVRVRLLVLQDLLIFLDISASVEDLGADFWHVLAETNVLVLDLEGQLASVAQNEHTDFSIDGLHLLEGGQHKNRRLTQTRLGLAENIASEDGLRNAQLLDWSEDVRECSSNRFARRKSASRASVHPFDFPSISPYYSCIALRIQTAHPMQADPGHSAQSNVPYSLGRRLSGGQEASPWTLTPRSSSSLRDLLSEPRAVACRLCALAQNIALWPQSQAYESPALVMTSANCALPYSSLI